MINGGDHNRAGEKFTPSRRNDTVTCNEWNAPDLTTSQGKLSVHNHIISSMCLADWRERVSDVG
jgi:hypothetical protein